MSVQDYSSAPSRNPYSTAAKPSKVSLGKGKGTALASDMAKAPAKSGAAIQGFGGSKSGTGLAKDMGKADSKSGKTIQGFSGNGLLKAKV